MPQRVSRTFQARRALLRSLAPRYQQASPAQKTLLLDAFVEWTGYTRKYAIELLNHGKQDQQTIQRRRLPWYLRTQRKPRLHGLSTTTPSPWRKAQIPVRLFSPWEEDRPGFVEIDLVAHCGGHLDGHFLYTLTLTDLATGWTECIPLLEKSADAVLAALAQARTLFPFPLLGIDTDSGSEFLNEEVIAYCEQERLTFTRGRSGVKNDQPHVEQKNGAVVREAVGCVRLVGVHAYHQLREVYWALRLVVNCFQPSFKLRAKVPKGDQVRRVYDVAQTPLQRVLTSGVLSETRQCELSELIQQVDPLALSEHLDILRHTLLRGTHTTATDDEGEFVLPLFRFSLAACTSGPLLVFEEASAQAGHQEAPVSSDEILNGPRSKHDPLAGAWEEILALVQAYPEWNSSQILQEIGRQAPACAVSAPMNEHLHGCGTIRPHLQANWEEPWPPELIQGDPPKPRPTEPHLPEDAVSEACQSSAQAQPLPAPAPGTPSRTAGEHEAGHHYRQVDNTSHRPSLGDQ